MKKNLFRISKLIMLMGVIAWFASCSSDSNDDTGAPIETSNSIAQVVKDSDNFSTLEEALTKTNLESTFEGQGSFTLMAPTNAAFQAYFQAKGYSNIDDIPVDSLKNVLLNHVLKTKTTASEMTKGYVSTMATNSEGNNLSLYVNTDSGVTFNGEAMVEGQDVEASNGVIITVDDVIDVPTVKTMVMADASMSAMADAFTMGDGTTNFAKLANTSSTKITLLVPSNDALKAFEANVSSDSNASAEIENTLLNHFMAGTHLSSSLETGYSTTMAKDSEGKNLSIYINTNDDVMFNNEAKVTTSDIITINGVIHQTDKVVEIPTIETFLKADNNFETLLNASTEDGLSTDFEAMFEGNNDITLFAPTNAAFTDFAGELNTSVDALDTVTLNSVLEYHVSSNMYLLSDLVNGLNITSSLGTTINVKVNADTNVTLTDAKSRTANVTTEITASNGVMFSIDKVLLPAITL
ncbi:fasciclin domain-containing protein [Zhouia sp. PK063]|uniref:fasciclin domain-containing protein n=1 Tax=Zhouia sp. PK063 TaxID=3373602 RepID=UPI0037AC46F9